MIMLWIFFLVGLLIALAGVVVRSKETNIEYKGWTLDTDDLGHGLIWLGGILSSATLIGVLFVMSLKILQ